MNATSGHTSHETVKYTNLPAAHITMGIVHPKHSTGNTKFCVFYCSACNGTTRSGTLHLVSEILKYRYCVSSDIYRWLHMSIVSDQREFVCHRPRC